jgi:hypothetical protein
MKTFARIHNNKVLDVIDFDPTGRFHQELAWLYQEVPSHVKANAVLVDGAWVNEPEPEPLTPEQIGINEAAIAAAMLEQLADSIRSDRNVLLSQTDWSQAVDAPQAIKDKYATYRQALRDIPQQEGFPATVVWPTQPV